jgi:two-component system phosphate regulon sensor histidine kinase PhoR
MQKKPVKILLCIEDPSLRGQIIALLDQDFPELSILKSTSLRALQETLTQIACDAVVSDRVVADLEYFSTGASCPLVLQVGEAAVSASDSAGLIIDRDALTEIPDHVRSHLRQNTPSPIRSERYQAFFDASLDAVFIENVAGDILDCNATAAQMFGYTQAELRGLSARDLVPADVESRMSEVVERHSKDTALLIKTKGKRRDGTVFPTEVSTRLVSIEGKRRVVVYVRDLTTESQVQVALLESEQLYRTLFEQANEAIFIENKEDQILDVNSKACELMGYSREELLQMTVPDLQAPEVRGIRGATLKAELTEYHGAPFETTNLHKDGTRIPVEVTNSTLTYRDKHLIVSIVRDIRARKQVEMQRRVQQERLQRQQETLIRLSMDAELVNQPLTEALGTIVQETAQVLDVERASIWRRGEASSNLYCLAAVESNPDRSIDKAVAFLDSEVMSEYFASFQHLRALAVSDVLQHEKTAELAVYWQSEGITSTLDVPVRLRGKTIGLVCYEHLGDPRTWREDEIAFAGQITDLIAQLFMNADLRRRAEEMTAIADISQQITILDSLEHVLDFIAQRATEILDVDAGGVIGRGPNQDYVIATYGFDEHLNRMFRSPQMPEDLAYLFDFIRQHDAALQIPDPHVEISDVVARGLAMLEAEAVLVAPIGYGEGAVEGYLGVISHTPCHFGPGEISFLTTLARQSANAIENASILQAEQERRELAEALSEGAAIVNSNLDPEEVLDRILEQVARVVDGDTFNIMLLDGHHAVSTRRRGYESLDLSEANITMDVERYPLLRRMIHARQPVVVPDTTHSSEWTSDVEEEWRHSYVGAPICIGSETVGFLSVNSMQSNNFSQDDARRLKTFADYAATAIQNARLFQKLRDYADSLGQKVRERTVELQAQYARLEAVLNSTTDGIIVTTKEGTILQENSIVTAWRQDLFSVEDLKRFQEAVVELADDAISYPDLVLEMSEMDLQLRAAPIVGTTTGTADVVIAAHDVSQLKALERMKSQFISNVSHELRTPITTINLYLQLMRQSSSEKHEVYMQALETEAERQAKLIQEILEFSSLNAGKLQIQRDPIQLNRLVDEVLSGQQPLAEQKRIAVHRSLSEELPDAFGNSDKIKQVLINLITNAIQYTPSGGEVTVITDVQCREGQKWIIACVEDTGFGISSEDMPHIFKRFYRGEKPRDLQISGTGLGLAIVKEIMELHQGWVDVKSELEKGSAFTIGLPSAASIADST